MILRGITIRTKLLLAVLATVLLLFSSALFFADAMRELQAGQDLLKARSAWQGRLHAAMLCVEELILDKRPGRQAECIRIARLCESDLEEILAFQAAGSDPDVAELAQAVTASLERLSRQVRESAVDAVGNRGGLRTALRELSDLATDFDTVLTAVQASDQRRNLLQLILAFMLAIFLIAISLGIFSARLNHALGKLEDTTRTLGQGGLPDPLEPDRGDELERMAAALNRHSERLREQVRYITSYTSGEPMAIFKPDKGDELGKAIAELSDYMTKKELDEVTRNREDKTQNWISEGTAQLGEILRSERGSVSELSYLVIQQLVTYMRVEMGSIFIGGDPEQDPPVLELTASYAYDRRKYTRMTLQWGEGLPGTCALEKERIFLTDVPEDYFEIHSGTGHALPNCILLVPLKIGERVLGVLELATARLLKPFEIDFVEGLSESIASSVEAVQTSERTTGLLEQSQEQAETLKKQEGVLLEQMEKLEQAQEESRKKESEISGILSAINQSSLVAEFGLNGRFAEINEQFLLLLETHRDQVVGKQHSEFAQVDPYSEEYKAFWATLREGKGISNVERYRLFSGKEVWLKQTFTPIKNSEGNVHKILDIATDITEAHRLEEELKTREQEIRRSHLDMQTLNEAVDGSLIKCELDAEGIIMHVNGNYTEVTGYSHKELLGRNYRLFLAETEKEQFEKIWKEISKEKVYEGVIRRSKPTGEEVWLAATFSPVKDEAGAIYKVYFLGLDITEKKLKYQLLEDANREIDRLKERLNDTRD